MKNRNIKERRIDRMELLFMHIVEFAAMLKRDDDNEQSEWIEKVVRPAIPYSVKTNNCDIWFGFRRLYLEHMDIQKQT